MMMLLINLGQFGVKMVSSALREFQDRVHTGSPQQFGVLASDALEAKEVRLVYQSENMMMSDTGFFFEVFTPAGGRPGFKKTFDRCDSDGGKFFSMGRSDAFNFVDVRHGSGGYQFNKS